MISANDIESLKEETPILVAAPIQSNESALTESVRKTIARDAGEVASKLRFFLAFEREDAVLLRAEITNYELWGPLAFCLGFAALLVARQPTNFEQIFSVVVTFAFVGAVALAVNTRLLGARVTLSQGICFVGYTAAPMLLVAFAAAALGFLPRFVLCALIAVGVGWSAKCGQRAVRCLVAKDRELAAALPFALFHASLGWFVLVCS